MNGEETIFAEALGLDTAGARDAYLDRACAGDVELRRAVEALLRAHEQAPGILESPVAGLGAISTIAPAVDGVGSTVGPYKLLEQIGGGGMGVVYMAEQLRPVRRKVALKIIKPGMDSGQVIARFEAERQALTMMDHPNIAKVLDAGTTDTGRPYFVMELVKGIPITDYCDQARLSTRQRLELFIQVCHAVQHAHQKGVIHRDLKPSNVLVTLHDDKPVPKVIDFGIAKAAGQVLTEKTLFTNYAQMLGTPLYMSPEQAQISGLDVDTRSDVYSLGVLLYELLTGTTPFDKRRLKEAAYDEMRRIIREEDPPRPSTRLNTMGQKLTTISVDRQTDPKKLSQLVRGELDWIVMKALEKERARRYESANGLGRDLERYLRDETVHACPPSTSYRMLKLYRRHRVSVLMVCVLLLALLAGIVGTTWGLIRANAARADAVREAASRAVALQEKDLALLAAQQSDRAKAEQLWHALVAHAAANRVSGRPGRRFQTLETLKRATELAHKLSLPAESFLELRNAAIATLAFPDLYLGPPWIPWSEEKIFFDADEAHSTYSYSDWGGNTSIRRVADGVELYHLPGRGGPARAHFTRDGKYISIMHCDEEQRSLAVEVWRLEGATAQRLLNENDAHWPDFLASREVAVSYHDGSIRVFELPSGRELHHLTPATIKRELNVALHPVEPLLAACSYFDSVVQIRDLRTGEVLSSLPQADPPLSICWDRSGRLLAVGIGNTAPIRVYDRTTLPTYRTLTTSGGGTYVSFNCTGDRLLSISWGGILEVFDVGTGERLLTSPPTAAWNRLNPDSTRYFGGYEDKRYGIFALADGREYRKLLRRALPEKGEYFPGAVSPDGRLLAVSVIDGIGLWDLETGSEVGFIPAEGREIHPLFQPSGSLLTLVHAGLLRWPIAYDPKTGGNPIAGPPEHLELPFGDDLAQSGDGRIIVTSDRKSGSTKRDAGGWILHTDRTGRPGKPIHVDAGNDIGRIMISRDGRWIFTNNHVNGSLNIFDARDGTLVKSIPHGGGNFAHWTSYASCFSPDGRWVFTGVEAGRLLELGSWEWGPRVPSRMQYAPAGNFFAVATTAGIRLFDQATQQELATLEDPSLEFAQQILFTPDASKIIAINRNSGIRVWDLRLIRQHLQSMGLDWQASE